MSLMEAKNKLKALKHLKNSHLSKEYVQSIDAESHRVTHNGKFHFYKLQYHVGSDLFKVIKQVASSQNGNNSTFVMLLNPCSGLIQQTV